MKKILVPIIFILCCWVAFAHKGNSNVYTAIFTLSENDHTGSFVFHEEPNAEFEVLHRAVSANSSSRHQQLPAFFNPGFSFQSTQQRNSSIKTEAVQNPAFKNYLSHIYPSHNFW